MTTSILLLRTPSHRQIMNSTHRVWRRAAAVLIALSLLLPAAACDVFDSLLSVEAPSRIPAEELESPGSIGLLLNGAKADFECAYGSYVVMSGFLAGELTDATQTAARWPYTRRVVAANDAIYGTAACASLGVYKGLSTARWDAETVLGRLEAYTDAQVQNRTVLIATAAAYSGYSHLLLGEGFCSGVLLDEALEPSGEVPREQLLERAVLRFTRAIDAAQAAGSAPMLNLARVGRARAYLDLGRKAEAAADARLVPAGFVYHATFSTIDARRYNRVYSQVNQTELASIGEEYRALRHMGVADPRVEVVNTGRVATDGTPLFRQTRYDGLEAPIPMASYDEARLILAEAEGGQTAVDVINAFHARAGLPSFASSDAAEILEHVLAERQAVLFLTGHRLFDVARHGLTRVPAAGTPYPKGGSYGTDTCFPLPEVERLNNPKIGA